MDSDGMVEHTGFKDFESGLNCIEDIESEIY